MDIAYLMFTDIEHVHFNGLQSETSTRRKLCSPESPSLLQTAQIPTLKPAAKSNGRAYHNTHQTASSPFSHLFANILFLHPARGLSAISRALPSTNSP